MGLTKNEKKLVDALSKTEPIMGFYHVIKIAPIAGLSIGMTQQVCETLSNCKYIIWGDKQHTAFRLTSLVSDYKSYRRIELQTQWLNRLWGFIAGILLSVITAYLTGMLEL